MRLFPSLGRGPVDFKAFRRFAARFRADAFGHLRNNTGILLDKARFQPAARTVTGAAWRELELALPSPLWGRGAGGEGVTLGGGGVETPPFPGTRCKAFLCVQAAVTQAPSLAYQIEMRRWVRPGTTRENICCSMGGPPVANHGRREGTRVRGWCVCGSHVTPHPSAVGGHPLPRGEGHKGEGLVRFWPLSGSATSPF